MQMIDDSMSEREGPMILRLCSGIRLICREHEDQDWIHMVHPSISFERIEASHLNFFGNRNFFFCFNTATTKRKKLLTILHHGTVPWQRGE